MIVKNIHIVAVVKENGPSSYVQFQKVYETRPTPMEKAFFIEDNRGYLTSITEETFHQLEQNPIP